MVAPTDPLYARQWHLPMIGKLNKIWIDYSGAGVAVAVYDDGVQFGHPDLAANYAASRHFTFEGVTYVPTPLATGDAHGTACAGLIAAVEGNGKGGTGVAHGATITGIDYLNTLQYEYDWDTQSTSALYDAVMRWAAGFDIMSNSWGTDPDYRDELNLNEPGNASAVDAAHFAWVSQTGRGGLGTIIVKAAGNDTRNANGDGTNVSRHTITVAATDSYGYAANYSNFGSSILVAAPAASVTTDLTGAAGYNGASYTSNFGGTSAATPLVAGVVALMLEANDGLGWRDVQSILAMSASHTGSPVWTGPEAAEIGPWLVMGNSQWNCGGSIYHESYGFGMVDAYAAVRMAEVWTRMNGAAGTSANEVHLRQDYSGFSVTLADSDGNNSTAEGEVSFEVTEDIEIDSVQVTIRVVHFRATDMVIYLVSPTGEKIALNGRNLPDGTLEWTFAAEAFRGMSSLGTWTIEVHDREAGTTGRIWDARLDFYGSAASTDDVHSFTDDFLMLSLHGTDRWVIDDQDGGIDWLNFAAMNADMLVNMVAGGSVWADAEHLARLSSGTAKFENLQTGDGRDVLTGNGLANAIYGGRGSDKIAGGKGADRLEGEQGADRLVGGTGADTLAGGADNDVFLFHRGFGQDRITDWANDHDSLRLDDAIWGGGLTVADVLSSFGSVVAGAAVLAFAPGKSITLEGVTNLNTLLDDITII